MAVANIAARLAKLEAALSPPSPFASGAAASGAGVSASCARSAACRAFWLERLYSPEVIRQYWQAQAGLRTAMTSSKRSGVAGKIRRRIL